jgi:hypothetical protein
MDEMPSFVFVTWLNMAGREPIQLEGLIGFFASAVVIRSHVLVDRQVAEVIDHPRETVLRGVLATAFMTGDMGQIEAAAKGFTLRSLIAIGL